MADGLGGGNVKVLVACEFSGVVRSAFRAAGHDAYSCDLLESEDSSHYHVVCHDEQYIHVLLKNGWDILLAFPPCTHLASSGARWFREKHADGRQHGAVKFFMAMVNAPVPRIAVENPVGIMSTYYRKPDQVVQPWQHGHGETKATCLWLKNLPKLQPSNIVAGRKPRVHYESPGPNRWKNRSRTLEGVAKAMASQWGNL